MAENILYFDGDKIIGHIFTNIGSATLLMPENHDTFIPNTPDDRDLTYKPEGSLNDW